MELRDNDKARFDGKGVRRAIANVKGEIRDALIGQDAGEQVKIDRMLLDLDGTPNKVAARRERDPGKQMRPSWLSNPLIWIVHRRYLLEPMPLAIVTALSGCGVRIAIADRDIEAGRRTASEIGDGSVLSKSNALLSSVGSNRRGDSWGMRDFHGQCGRFDDAACA